MAALAGRLADVVELPDVVRRNGARGMYPLEDGARGAGRRVIVGPWPLVLVAGVVAAHCTINWRRNQSKLTRRRRPPPAQIGRTGTGWRRQQSGGAWEKGNDGGGVGGGGAGVGRRRRRQL